MRPLVAAVAALLAMGALAGCIDNGDAPADTDVNHDGEQDPQQEPIVIAVPTGWLGEELRSIMIETVLTEELGYDVNKIEDLEVGPIYQSIASGDADVYVGAWFPIQNSYLESQPEGSIERIGHNLPPQGVYMGVGVPKYVYDAGVTSLEDLEEHAEKFDKEIIGFNPGGGMMVTGAERMGNDIYGLGDWTLVEGSVSAMLAAYQDALRDEEWIAMTVWEPHFMFAKWSQGPEKLMRLEDPGYGTNEDGETRYLYKDQSDAATVETLVPSGFTEEYPKAAKFLENFQVHNQDENQMMLWVDEGMTAEEAAAQYMEQNPDVVEGWLEGVE